MKKILLIALLLISILSFGQGKKVVLRVSGTGGSVGGGAAWGAITGTLSSQTDLQSALDLKAPLASPTFTGTVSGITASMVGLGNVENTALSTWAGSTNIASVGTITTGIWNGTEIGDAYISSASTWNAKQTALSGTGLLSFSGTTPSYNTTSSEIATIISDEVGTGSLVFNTGTNFSGNTGFGAASTGSLIEVTNNALGASPASTSGITRINNTAAAAGAQQSSPVSRSVAQGWKTTATAASQTVEFQDFVLPVQGSSAPSGLWKLQSQINGGGWSDVFSMSSAGALAATTGVFSSTSTASQFIGTLTTTATAVNANLNVTSTTATSYTASQLLFAGASTVNARITMRGSTNSAPPAGASYSSIIFGEEAVTIAGSGTHGLYARAVFKPLTITAGAGTLTESATLYIEGAATGATSNYSLHVKAGTSYMEGATIFGSTATLKGYTVATLPAGTVGMVAYVTDATAPTYNAALTGGGAVAIPVFYNGAAWVSH